LGLSLAQKWQVLQNSHMPRRNRKNADQLEFVSLAAEAEAASRKLVAQRKAQRRWARMQGKALREPESGLIPALGYNGEWIKTVKTRIKQCVTLCEGVVLTAARLAEPIDLEIDHDGHEQEWKEKYAAFCEIKKSMHATSEKGDELVHAVWDSCAKVFSLYDALNTISEWSLYEKFCSGQEDKLEAASVQSKEKDFLEQYAERVAWLHILVAGYQPWNDVEDDAVSKS